MSSNVDKDSVVRGDELVLDMMVAAIQANVPATAIINVSGVAYTQPDFLKKAESYRSLFKAKRNAKEAAKVTVANVNAAQGEIAAFVQGSKIGVKALIGEHNPALEKFGFKVDKRGSLSVEEKALAVEKGRRTREARHTMGARQKDAIHGEPVSEVVIHDPKVPAPNGQDNGGAGTQK